MKRWGGKMKMGEKRKNRRSKRILSNAESSSELGQRREGSVAVPPATPVPPLQIQLS